jgi:adenine phosphoribosyltransferase
MGRLFIEKEFDMENLSSYLRDVPNFPKEGILFKDISPLLANPEAFQFVVQEMAKEWSGRIDAVAALDARGFIFGSALAFHLKVPLVLVRKKGKLPGEAFQVSYGLEYGKDTIELQKNAFVEGARILVVDDLLATGGTAAAACSLVELAGGVIAGCAFVVKLSELDGRAKLPNYALHSLLVY